MLYVSDLLFFMIYCFNSIVGKNALKKKWKYFSDFTDGKVKRNCIV